MFDVFDEAKYFIENENDMCLPEFLDCSVSLYISINFNDICFQD